MKKKALWLAMSCLMALALVMAACSPAPSQLSQEQPKSPVSPSPSPSLPSPAVEQPQKPPVALPTDAPKYGGTLNEVRTGDVTTWDLFGGPLFNNLPTNLTNQSLWAGDWTKGPAGGYGTNEIDWSVIGYDPWNLSIGYIAESVKWTVDSASNRGTIVYQIRRGIRYAINTRSFAEASRLVNGRELTGEDVALSLTHLLTATNPQSMIITYAPQMRAANVTQTAPWEVTVKAPLEIMAGAILRLSSMAYVMPKEVIKTYGTMNEMKKNVGTGPFVLDSYVPGSILTYARNSSFWMEDPIGPGKGNKLPYVDMYRQIIIPDASTRLAALRTGKIDTMTVGWEDANQVRKTNPDLVEMQIPGRDSFAIKLRVDKPPYNDIRVRRALMMATDFEAINKSLNNGGGQILNYPIPYYKAYAGAYLGLDDPEMPASVKELYAYNQDKAKALLKEAGYPTGFKTKALVTSTEVDIFSVYKDYWSKVGVQLELDVRETGAKNSIIMSRNVEDMTRNGATPISAWYGGSDWVPGSGVNPGNVNDQRINETMPKIQKMVVTDLKEAMRMYKDLLKYILDQAYAIPVSAAPSSRFWWPWLKNYSGEVSIGYIRDPNWVQWAWIDQGLKKKMGY